MNILPILRKCTSCKTEKELDKFRNQKLGKYGKRSLCRICHNKADRLNKAKRRSTISGHLKALLYRSRCRAKKLRIKHTLIFDDIMELHAKQVGLCAITKIPLTFIHENQRIKTNISIDRIDSAKGYTKDNTQLVCDIVNTMKSDMNMKEFENWCRLILNRGVV